ncbi:MAG: MFS transporter [Gammaproteobacteria bacterium]|nr:MFS transporter [Gammaproteobacteria bacterium]MCY4282732.1 MFS transporter [Gammaproteobacteria bacterium]
MTNNNRALYAIFACVVMYGFTLGLSRPLLALLLEARGIDRSLIGLNAAMPAIGIFLSTPFIPVLVEKLGMQRFLLLVLALDLVTLLQFPRFDHLYAWFALGISLGAMTNCLLVTSETWINEIVTDANRGRLMGLYNGLLAATIALGPLVIPAVGIQGWTPFLIGAGAIALAALPLLWTGAHRLSTQDEPSFNILSFVWVAPTLVVAVLLFSAKETAGNSLLPVYGIRSGMSEASAAVMLTVAGLGGVVLSYPMGWLADRFNRYGVLVCCGLGSLLGAILLPYAMNSGIFLYLLLFGWGGAFAGIYTAVLTLIGQHFRGRDLVTANVSLGMLWGLGSLIWPPLTGMAMDIRDPGGFPVVFIAVSLLFVLFATSRLLWRRDNSVIL